MSTEQITGMIMAAVLPLILAVLLFIWIRRHSRKIEAGMMGAVGYGVFGYIWQELIYVLAYSGVIYGLYKVDWFKSGLGTAVTKLLTSILFAVFVTIGLFWGVYLTNDKQRSLYRSAAIGLGFSVGYIGWTYAATYAMPLKYAYQMSAGTFTGGEKLKNQLLSLSVTNMYMFIANCLLMMLILIGTTLIMGKFYHEERRVTACLISFVSQFAISFINAILPMFLPGTAAMIVFYVILVLLGLYSLWILSTFLTSGKLDWRLLFLENRQSASSKQKKA